MGLGMMRARARSVMLRFHATSHRTRDIASDLIQELRRLVRCHDILASLTASLSHSPGWPMNQRLSLVGLMVADFDEAITFFTRAH